MDVLTEVYNDLLDSGVMVASGSYHLKGECDSVLIRQGDKYGIFLDIDKIRTLPQEREAVVHKWTHIQTGSTYTLDATETVREKAENRADKVQIKKLIPKDELDAAVADGRTEMWELAEIFGVSEDFMCKAVHWYTYGNLATE